MPSPLTGTYQLGIEVPGGSPLVVGEASPVADVTLVSINGLGPTVLDRATPRSLASGVAVGFDTNGARQLKLTLEVFTPGDDDAAMDLWTTLNDAFEAVEEVGTLRNLWLWLPGSSFGHREFVGRPRGMTDDGLVSMPHGYIEVTCAFDITTGDLGTVVV